MKFYRIHYPGVLGHEGHTPKKLLSTTLHTLYLAEIWKILCLVPSLLCVSSTAAVPSTIITKRCVLGYVQLLQNREYLQYGLSNGKHR